MSRLLRPGWLLAHLTLVGGIVLCVVCSRWQWNRGASGSGSARNYLYSVQWVIFGVLGVGGWARAVLDAVRPGEAGLRVRSTPLPASSYVDRPAIDDSDDPELAAYNAMLARRAAQA